MIDDVAKKTRLRAEALGRRNALGEGRRVEASLAIHARILTVLPFEPARIVSGFLPIRSEVDLQPLMASLRDQGLRLCLPAIVGADLEFREFTFAAPLEPQGYGTYAPGPGAERLDPDIMLVPLAAFDRRCHRIGYGGGYYDRAIAALRAKGAAPFTVGIAFAAQEIEAVPDEPHDIALDVIVTESAIHRAS